MKVETIGDVINWSRLYHKTLADCLANCKDHALLERGRMLLTYLADHERQLSTILEGFERSGNAGALHTWCYDYLEKYPIRTHPDSDAPYASMSTQEVMQRIEEEHNQIIGLYKHLRGRVDSPSAIELIDQLISLEEHEAMRMAHSANRLEDL